MAEYLIKEESLTAIADEVRELSGTTEPMSLEAMASNVGNANTEVDEQADLIAQIQSALDGKAGGGNNVTYNTCTVHINNMINSVGSVLYTRVTNDGTLETGDLLTSETITDVLCGSTIVFVGTYLAGTATIGEVVIHGTRAATYSAPMENNAIATVTLSPD